MRVIIKPASRSYLLNASNEHKATALGNRTENTTLEKKILITKPILGEDVENIDGIAEKVAKIADDTKYEVKFGNLKRIRVDIEVPGTCMVYLQLQKKLQHFPHNDDIVEDVHVSIMNTQRIQSFNKLEYITIVNDC